MSKRDRQPRQDLTGQRFNKLVVAQWGGNSRWLCRCDCGGETLVLTANLKRGNTGSCGCIRNAAASKRATTHGFSNTPAYKSWRSIKKRCTNPKEPMFQTYGGEGIRLCDEWLNDAAAFCRYIGQPLHPDMSVDRIDNTRGYEPGNIRWATPKEQARNRSVCVKIEFQGRTYSSIAEFVEWLSGEIKVNRNSLHREVQRMAAKLPG